jgi:hypothetical protein
MKKDNECHKRFTVPKIFHLFHFELWMDNYLPALIFIFILDGRNLNDLKRLKVNDIHQRP